MLRVLVVDDSPTARALIVAMLRDDDELAVAGEASDGEEAVRMAAQLRPDVITMDIHMPGMSGFEATKQIMIATPTPIVIVTSSGMADEVATGMRALRAGALTLLRKPSGPGGADYDMACAELVETVKSMADVKVVRHFRPPSRDPSPGELSPGELSPGELSAGAPGDTGPDQAASPAAGVISPDLTGPSWRVAPAAGCGIVALAASTGGPPAIQQVLAELPVDFPWPILVVQHIATGFADGFAKWLDATVKLPVETAQPGVPCLAGQVYVAPEDRHLGVSLTRSVEVSDSPQIGGFRPSATYLFHSVARVYRDAALAVIMTGMGSDGVDGLRAVKQSGGTVIAQDEATSVVFGMPGAAISARVVDDTVGLPQLADRIQQFARQRTGR